MRAYDESYLNDAMNALGEMLDYAVVDCGRDPDEFFDWFIVSGIAAQFERGNPKFVAGMSGAEIAREVIFRVTGNRETRPATQSLDRSPEYWAGWILAYYQWYRNLRFAAIAEGGLPPSAVIERYILHEADVSKFVETADEALGAQLQQPTPLADFTTRFRPHSGQISSLTSSGTLMRAPSRAFSAFSRSCSKSP